MTRLLALVAFLWAGAAAAEMPRYQVEAHCKEIASFGGSYSASLFNACFDMEQVAYNGLKPRWDRLPHAMRGHCDDIASFGGPGSYALLESCVQMEEAASSTTKKFNY
jgi:hypothetical protein